MKDCNVWKRTAVMDYVAKCFTQIKTNFLNITVPESQWDSELNQPGNKSLLQHLNKSKEAAIAMATRLIDVPNRGRLVLCAIIKNNI